MRCHGIINAYKKVFSKHWTFSKSKVQQNRFFTSNLRRVFFDKNGFFIYSSMIKNFYCFFFFLLGWGCQGQTYVEDANHNQLLLEHLIYELRIWQKFLKIKNGSQTYLTPVQKTRRKFMKKMRLSYFLLDHSYQFCFTIIVILS